MKRLVTYGTLVGLLFCSILSAKGQVKEQYKVDLAAEVNVLLGFPLGNFEENVDQPMPGITVAFGGKFPNLPLELTTELGYMSFGTDDLLELRLNDNSVPVQTIGVASTNSAFMGHLKARIVPSKGVIRPYLDAVAGIRYFSTHTSIESSAFLVDNSFFDRNNDASHLFTSANFDSFSLSSGVGTGIEFLLFDGPLGIQTRQTSILLQLDVRYLYGSKAEYLLKDSILRENGRITFDMADTETNMLIPRLGIKIVS